MLADESTFIIIYIYIINLQTTKFFNLTLILFASTDCFACLGSSGAVKNLIQIKILYQIEFK